MEDKFSKRFSIEYFYSIDDECPKENYFKIYSLEGMIMCPKNIYPCNTRNTLQKSHISSLKFTVVKGWQTVFIGLEFMEFENYTL